MLPDFPVGHLCANPTPTPPQLSALNYPGEPEGKMGKDRLQHLVFNVRDLKYSFHFLNKNTLIKKVQNKCLVVAHLPLMNSLKTKVLLNAVQGILIHIDASSYSGTLTATGLDTSINNENGMLIWTQQTECSTESHFTRVRLYGCQTSALAGMCHTAFSLWDAEASVFGGQSLRKPVLTFTLGS